MQSLSLLRSLLLIGLLVWTNTGQASPFVVHDAGHGKAVLILSGGPGFTAWNLLPLQQQIAKQHRALLFDMRGMGDQANLPLTQGRLLDQWVADIEAVRRDKGIKQWTLVGHSWGGIMALLYAKAYPDHVRQILLLNPVDPEKRGLVDILDRINERQAQFKPDAWDAEFDEKDTNMKGFAATDESVRLYQIRHVLPTYFVNMAQGETYAAQFTAQDFSPEINSRIWQEYDARPFNRSDARRLKKPVVFADCDQDLLMPENLQGLKDYFPHMKQKIFKNCAHFPWVEQPKAFYPWLNKTLAGGN
ncbi:MAG: alpha/beta hydrolase [Gammaproteobacteria bacterium]|nr:alpha/beta hydrolase [Gammaproteobacteria bacterium]